MPKTRKSVEYRIRRISIDVCRNDSVDIRCGGPAVLGFDFTLDADMTPAAIKKKLMPILDAYCHSCMGIRVERPTWGRKPWTWADMEECIRKDGPYMR
jgi:hypothetical protein